ncbi:hypothetical protein MPSEU_001096100 [Mayamaea pseudoterrestris]|nr:hypothetical protein MPSEU_001096100 [Mayamaea pseudoterrestris]
MRVSSTIVSICMALVASLSRTDAFVPSPTPAFLSSSTSLYAKYKTMDEILAKFPDDKPILINFYDSKTESTIKEDIVRAKNLLSDRCVLVSIKQQDYPELAKLWDADQKSPSMILFKDGSPVTRIYEESNYLEIAARVGRFCD